VGDRLSPVPAAIADEIVGGRCTHRPPAGASFPCFDCSFGCYNPRNCSQIADVPPPTVAYHAILTSLTHRSATHRAHGASYLVIVGAWRWPGP